MQKINWRDFFLIPRPIDWQNPPKDPAKARLPAYSSKLTGILTIIVFLLVVWILPSHGRRQLLAFIGAAVTLVLRGALRVGQGAPLVTHWQARAC